MLCHILNYCLLKYCFILLATLSNTGFNDVDSLSGQVSAAQIYKQLLKNQFSDISSKNSYI